MSQSTLEEQFCHRFGCQKADYPMKALSQFMHSPWNRLAPLLQKIAPAALRTDLQIVQQLGRVTTAKNLAAEIRDLRSDYFRLSSHLILRNIFKFRLSGRRITEYCGDFWRGTSAIP